MVVLLIVAVVVDSRSHSKKETEKKKVKEKIIFYKFSAHWCDERVRASTVQDDSTHSASRPSEARLSTTSAWTNRGPGGGRGWATPVSVTPHPVTHDAPGTTVSAAVVSRGPGFTLSGSPSFLLLNVQANLTAEHDWLRTHNTLHYTYTHTHFMSCMLHHTLNFLLYAHSYYNPAHSCPHMFNTHLDCQNPLHRIRIIKHNKPKVGQFPSNTLCVDAHLHHRPKLWNTNTHIKGIVQAIICLIYSRLTRISFMYLTSIYSWKIPWARPHLCHVEDFPQTADDCQGDAQSCALQSRLLQIPHDLWVHT